MADDIRKAGKYDEYSHRARSIKDKDLNLDKIKKKL